MHFSTMKKIGFNILMIILFVFHRGKVIKTWICSIMKVNRIKANVKFNYQRYYSVKKLCEGTQKCVRSHSLNGIFMGIALTAQNAQFTFYQHFKMFCITRETQYQINPDCQIPPMDGIVATFSLTNMTHVSYSLGSLHFLVKPLLKHLKSLQVLHYYFFVVSRHLITHICV